MKRPIIFLVLLLILPVFMIAQETVWPVQAVNRGNFLPVKAFFEDGTSLPVNAVIKDGDDHFMDVKVIKDGENLPVKLIVSSDYYVPVKAILSDGTLVDIKAEQSDGTQLDVKGVSRDGNTIKIAAITPEENFITIKAVSPEGSSREVRGIKFIMENIEMEIAGVKVQAHVKAIPNLEVSGVDPVWFVKAFRDGAEDLDVVAISSKGKEYPVRATMDGTSAHLMEVGAALSSLDVMIKLMKEDNRMYVLGMDEYGRKFDIRAKEADGSLYELIGGEQRGNVIPIKAKMSDGTLLPVKAFSSEGHIFDVKGIKVMEDEVEGIVEGLSEWIRFYAHVKAIAPIN